MKTVKAIKPIKKVMHTAKAPAGAGAKRQPSRTAQGTVKAPNMSAILAKLMK